ncbi:glycine cleavage system aminomethyltransferase GcvT [Rarobacter faecitabidus]|uniref:Aminomethyltransferase n=1 Tax=Rarobacter faecitabidus TaxID=13243 RepID=A0A542ZA78_RARFA|nr:glycine cleavage system aminomethyltransferase GcvT [Rarobacter faecitabidus]TQL57244.1 aminomethyltransferase [Rarobacter faecitabidus]
MTSKTSPLLGEHAALGASLTEFGGWQMPLRYDSDISEHNAVRTAAGLFDISHMGQILVTGPGAAAALDYAVVGWASQIGEGRARYTMICAEDGGVIDDLVIYRLVQDEFLVVANAGNTDAVVAALTERAATFDAAVSLQEQVALIAIQGPAAELILRSVAGDYADAIGALKYYAIIEAKVAGHRVRVARTGYTGEDGFEVFASASQAVALWHALLAAGANHGLIPAGLSARDSLRLEAGMPLYGHELDLTTTPFEAGLGRVVRLDKVDAGGAPLPFVGRAALESRRHSAPARVLVGLRALGRRAVRAGTELVIDPASPGRGIGRATSGAPSPTLGYPIAMAYVSPEFSAIGTELTAVVRGRGEAVQVVGLPFYRHQPAE